MLHRGLKCRRHLCSMGVALATLVVSRANPKGVEEKKPMSSIKEYVLSVVAEQPTLDNDSIAEMCRRQFPGASTTAASVSSIKSNARRNGELEKAEVTALGEILEDEEELPDDDGQIEAEIEERLSKRFNAMDRMADGVMKNIVPALIVSGPAGLGKSYGIKRALEKRKKELKEEGVDFKPDYVSGSISPVGLYIAAWNNREKGCVIVLDDCDDVFGDEVSLNLLKAMLDSQDRRELSWRKKSKWLEDLGIDDNFEFQGSVIFLTNLDFEKKVNSGKAYAVHFKALMDRCLYLHLTIRTIKDFMVRIKQVVYGENMLEQYGMEKDAIDEIMDYINVNRRRFYHLSLRLVHQIALLQIADSDNWRDDVSMTKMRADSESLADAVQKVVDGADVGTALKEAANA